MNAEMQKSLEDIEDVFVFNAPQSLTHDVSCKEIQEACKKLARLIVAVVPEGKEQTIAVNNLLSAALFARQGITRRQVLVVAVPLPVENAT